MSGYDKKKSLWWNIKRFLRKVTYTPRKIFRWTIKSFQYSIFLWGDYDWDYVYILKILQYKLKRTRKAIGTNQIIKTADLVAAEIKHAEDILEHLINDDFLEELNKAHEEKWGKVKIDDKEPVNIGGKTYYTMKMYREKATTKKLQEQEHKETMYILNKQEEAKNKAKKQLFDFIANRIEGWWD